jgi:hypothetical protein
VFLAVSTINLLVAEVKSKRKKKATKQEYYSARLLYVILVDRAPKKKNHYDESVIVFKATDFSNAFAKALSIGKANQAKFKNQYGEGVRWSLVEITTLDRVGPRIDGVEVASRLHPRTSARAIEFKQKFKPEKSKPSESF